MFDVQSMVLIEVQDTLAQMPSEINSMKKATGLSIGITVSLHTHRLYMLPCCQSGLQSFLSGKLCFFFRKQF